MGKPAVWSITGPSHESCMGRRGLCLVHVVVDVASAWVDVDFASYTWS